MAGTKFTKRNLQRYRKVYPFIRREPRMALVSDAEATIEVGALRFNNTNSETYIFEENFPGTPYISAISVDSDSNNSADVNVFVKSVTDLQVVIETSNDFTGDVHFHAIWVKP
jgi:hypothetical protein